MLSISNMNCILIPTYPPHFQYARKLIDSIRKFCQEDVTIYVATSTGEVFEHEHVLNFKGIISSVLTIDVNESELLTTVGHHSFQSIKKILCVRYLSKQYKHVYVLDSEGLFLRPFLLSDIVSTKRIFYNSRQRHEGEYEASTYARILLKTNKCVPGWFLENYLWVYNADIVHDFCNIVFPKEFTLADLFAFPKNVFIECAYYHHIYLNNHLYNYEFIDSYETMKLYNIPVDRYITSHFSILEDIRKFVTFGTIDSVARYFTDYKIINYKIEVNDVNLALLKKLPVVVINSGDFHIDFELTL